MLNLLKKIRQITTLRVIYSDDKLGSENCYKIYLCTYILDGVFKMGFRSGTISKITLSPIFSLMLIRDIDNGSRWSGHKILGKSMASDIYCNGNLLSRLNISNFPRIVLILVIYQEKFRKKYYTLKENNKNKKNKTCFYFISCADICVF